MRHVVKSENQTTRTYHYFLLIADKQVIMGLIFGSAWKGRCRGIGGGRGIIFGVRCFDVCYIIFCIERAGRLVVGNYMIKVIGITYARGIGSRLLCSALSHKGSLIPRYPFTSSSNPSQVPLLQETQAKILQILHQAKPSLFTPQTQPQDLRNSKLASLGLDSLDVMEIVVCMEESFGIELSDAQALKIDSIASAVEIFFAKVNARVMNKIVEKRNYEIRG